MAAATENWVVREAAQEPSEATLAPEANSRTPRPGDLATAAE